MGLFDSLTSLTGGGGLSGGTAGPSSAGPASGGQGAAGGISNPIVIGGFKTDGTASATSVVPSWFVPAALGVCVAGAIALLIFRRRK